MTHSLHEPAGWLSALGARGRGRGCGCGRGPGLYQGGPRSPTSNSPAEQRGVGLSLEMIFPAL